MKIKLDENLPIQLVPLLTDLGHDVETAPDEQIAGRDDHVVWTAAQAHGRFLVTRNLDFLDARKYAPGTHHGLLLVRLPQPGRTAPRAPLQKSLQVRLGIRTRVRAGQD